MSTKHYEPHEPITPDGSDVCTICNLTVSRCRLANFDRMAGAFIPFESEQSDSLSRGSDALLYVMAHGHTISVPTAALYFAEKVGVQAIADRHVHTGVLRDVNRALDIIAASLRHRDVLDREGLHTLALPAPEPERPNEGPMARLQPLPSVRPSGGQKVEIQF